MLSNKTIEIKECKSIIIESITLVFYSIKILKSTSLLLLLY